MHGPVRVLRWDNYSLLCWDISKIYMAPGERTFTLCHDFKEPNKTETKHNNIQEAYAIPPTP